MCEWNSLILFYITFRIMGLLLLGPLQHVHFPSTNAHGFDVRYDILLEVLSHEIQRVIVWSTFDLEANLAYVTWVLLIHFSYFSTLKIVLRRLFQSHNKIPHKLTAHQNTQLRSQSQIRTRKPIQCQSNDNLPNLRTQRRLRRSERSVRNRRDVLSWT